MEEVFGFCGCGAKHPVYGKEETYTKDETNRLVNDSANDLQDQINSLASGSPLVANSVNEMTDTTKVYVNTADGYWYYWNGTSWAKGDVFQSAQSGAVTDDLNLRVKLLEEKRAIQTTYENNQVKELYDDNSYKLTILDKSKIYEKWYSNNDTLIFSKTITLKKNSVNEVIN